jgi:hypothetical protein
MAQGKAHFSFDARAALVSTRSFGWSATRMKIGLA